MNMTKAEIEKIYAEKGKDTIGLMVFTSPKGLIYCKDGKVFWQNGQELTDDEFEAIRLQTAYVPREEL